MKYDVIIIGAGPGGIFSAYELMKTRPDLKVAVFEAGYPLEKRRCPIDGDKVKSCIHCATCAIMKGFGGAGAFSDGKYNITNDFGGTLYEHIGRQKALELMKYVDSVNMAYGGEGARIFSTAGTRFKKLCIQNKLTLLDASVRHLGTDLNYIVLKNLFDHLRDSVDFLFDTPVEDVRNATAIWCARRTKRSPATSSSSRSAEAAARGWRDCASVSASRRIRTASISACAWSCPRSSFRT